MGSPPRAFHVRSVDGKVAERQISVKVFRLFSLNIPPTLHTHALASERWTMDPAEAAIPVAIDSKQQHENKKQLFDIQRTVHLDIFL